MGAYLRFVLDGFSSYMFLCFFQREGICFIFHWSVYGFCVCLSFLFFFGREGGHIQEFFSFFITDNWLKLSLNMPTKWEEKKMWGENLVMMPHSPCLNPLLWKKNLIYQQKLCNLILALGGIKDTVKIHDILTTQKPEIISMQLVPKRAIRQLLQFGGWGWLVFLCVLLHLTVYVRFLQTDRTQHLAILQIS